MLLHINTVATQRAYICEGYPGLQQLLFIYGKPNKKEGEVLSAPAYNKEEKDVRERA